MTGDFNGDGKMDWAVANGGSSNIWIYLGKGDGTAQLPIVVPLKGTSPVALAAADMNHDGKLDLIVAEADSSSVGILLGNGDGTFAPEREFFSPLHRKVSRSPTSTATAIWTWWWAWWLRRSRQDCSPFSPATVQDCSVFPSSTTRRAG